MKRTLGAILAVASLSGCGSPALRQWVVASTKNSISPGANAQCDLINNDIQVSYGNSDATWSMYQGDDTHYFLNVGKGSTILGMAALGQLSSSSTIQGVLTNGIYTFSYSRLDDRTDSSNTPKWETKHVTTLTIRLTPDGAKVKGDYTLEDALTCKNLQANVDGCSSKASEVNDCITIGSLQGAELEQPKWVSTTETPAGNGPGSP